MSTNVKEQFKSLLVKEGFTVEDSGDYNLRVPGASPDLVSTSLGIEFSLDFTHVNAEAFSAKHNGHTVVVAAQGTGTVVMFKSY